MKRSPIVLILEDDPDDQLLLRNALNLCRPDIRISFFESWEELLDYLEAADLRGDDAPDLLVADLSPVGNNSFDRVGLVKRHPRWRRVPVIVLVGSGFEEWIEYCYELGANTVITKPSSFGDLTNVVTKTCDYWFGTVKM